MSEIRANTVSDAAGTGPVTLTGQYAAKSWVNFNGTGTVAIRESGNVSSLTDNNIGLYTINFTTAMPDANYAAVANAGTTNDDGSIVCPNAYNTSTFQVVFRKTTVLFDYVFCNVTIHR